MEFITYIEAKKMRKIAQRLRLEGIFTDIFLIKPITSVKWGHYQPQRVMKRTKWDHMCVVWSPDLPDTQEVLGKCLMNEWGFSSMHPIHSVTELGFPPEQRSPKSWKQTSYLRITGKWVNCQPALFLQILVFNIIYNQFHLQKLSLSTS